MARYVIACPTPWFWRAWEPLEQPPGEWTEVRDEHLSLELLEQVDPRYVFFPHWSQVVPADVLERWECICFHSTPLPYGRGGSPVQNMIAGGHTETAVTALRMVAELDAGPVYMSEQVSLLGGGDEVFLRIGRAIAAMIPRIAVTEPEPAPQEGEVVQFRRRTPDQSRLPEEASLEELFDFIRMLDARGYPAAFAEVGPWRLELGRPALRPDGIDADVRITRSDRPGESPSLE
jgi:methionyl-tRNA formyltransferase